ncbi:aspartate aminotransferase family protein [Thermoproteota archaeon]
MTNLIKRGSQVLSPVLGRYMTLEVKSGKGSYLYGTDGKAYLDFASGIAVASTGHCHPKVVNAIKKQAETLLHACIGIAYYEPPVELAEELEKRLGAGLNSVFFSQSGSEAVEACMKLAKYVTHKTKLLAFTGGFHGRTMGALSVTTSKNKYLKGYDPLLQGVMFFPYPYCYRCPWKKERSSCAMHCVSELEMYFKTIPADTAAALIEPILGEGGYTPAPHQFLKRLKELCGQKDMLLIFDEVQSGVGRAGYWGYFQACSVKPDILALAKGLGSGLPIGACVSTRKIMAGWSPGAHGGTFGGNPVSCSAGVATLKVLDKYVLKLVSLGETVVKELKTTLADHPYIGDIRGSGLMIGLELVTNKQSKEPNPDMAKAVIKKALEKGLIVISCGLFDNVIRVIPPLIITQKDLKKGLDILAAIIHDYH